MLELNTSEAQFLTKLIEERNLREFFDVQTRGISLESFTEEIPKAVWQFVTSYTQQYGQLPTMRAVQEQVPTFTPGSVPDGLDYYRDKFIKQSYRFQIARFTEKLAQKVQDQDDDLVDFIGSAYQGLIRNARISDFGKFKEMTGRIQEYNQRVVAGDPPMGIPTGITPLDEHFLGFRPGDYGVISGRTGEGKTTLALFMAHSAFMSGYKVSYITLEMPREQIFEKLDALATGISINKIKRLNLTQEEIQRYEQKAQEIAQKQTDINVHDRTGSCSVVTVEAILNQDAPDILFVDSIYLMRSIQGKSQWESIKETSNRLKQLAMKYRKPIIVLSQVNRDGANAIRGGELPGLDTLSYSDALGQDADHVFVITSNEKTRHYKAKRLSTMKLRGASEKDIAVRWDPTTNFIEYLDEYKNLRAPDAEVQQILDMQTSGGPFNATAA